MNWSLLFSQPDRSHAALGQLLQEPVRPDRLAFHRLSRRAVRADSRCDQCWWRPVEGIVVGIMRSE
jgi:hypothetical protein